jgi:hypothetical protein
MQQETWRKFSGLDVAEIDRSHFSRSRVQVASHFSVNLQQGMTIPQVAEAQRIYGKNELAPEPGTCLVLRWPAYKALRQSSSASRTSSLPYYPSSSSHNTQTYHLW